MIEHQPPPPPRAVIFYRETPRRGLRRLLPRKAPSTLGRLREFATRQGYAVAATVGTESFHQDGFASETALQDALMMLRRGDVLVATGLDQIGVTWEILRDAAYVVSMRQAIIHTAYDGQRLAGADLAEKVSEFTFAAEEEARRAALLRTETRWDGE